jgi:AcrR family transcriptional regulator
MDTSPDRPIPEPPWKAAPRQRPTRAPLTREGIVDAALRVLKREGADGLSMRRVAEELGTGPASLYWHVANKDELINLLIDRVASEIELPPPDPARWQQQLKEWVLQARQVFKRYPGVAALTLGRIPVGPNLVRWTEWLLALLRGAGMPDRIAAYAADLGACTWAPPPTRKRCPCPRRPARTSRPTSSWRCSAATTSHSRPTSSPMSTRPLDELFRGGPDERFELGLDVLIRGLASYIQR